MGLKWVVLLHLLVILNSTSFLLANFGDYPTANLSTSWTCSYTEFTSFELEGSRLLPVLMNNSGFITGIPAVGCGFYANGTFDYIYFVLFALAMGNPPHILWTANRDNLVKMNSTLRLTPEGDLVLRDADGSLAWSTNTAGRSVVGMKVTLSGNLLLFDSKSSVVWQSFDHPTDVWLPGQKLHPGQRLIASTSTTNFTAGTFYLSCTNGGLFAFVEANPPQMYRQVFRRGTKARQFKTGTLELLPDDRETNSTAVLYVPDTERYFQYMQLHSDGHLRVHRFREDIWSLMNFQGQGVSHSSTTFLKVQTVPSPTASPPGSGKTQNGQGLAIILGIATGMLAVLRVLIFIMSKLSAISVWVRRLGESYQREEHEEDGDEVDSIELLPDLPKRYSYEDLKSATENFQISKLLGRGGFGSVFEGILGDGTKVAVKRLDSLGQGKNEFLAEVRTMGSVHNVNLVKLMGFCAERSQRLLVYEYMSNGSLDKWIFQKTPETALDWDIRKKIIISVATGLAYLHGECNKRIAHLDIKPQNILLDDNLNARLSDFGLAKLIDRDQSHRVMTQMRGTRGYLAPEWLSRKITVKADVYSFGVVMLEVVCGRKNLDYSHPEENEHLLQILKKRAEENQLIELVDKCSEDMQRHGESAVEMLRIAIWCLHNNPARRPPMSEVVKILEGSRSAIIEPVSDYSFLIPTPHTETPNEPIVESSDAQQASILSGPR